MKLYRTKEGTYYACHSNDPPLHPTDTLIMTDTLPNITARYTQLKKEEKQNGDTIK